MEHKHTDEITHRLNRIQGQIEGLKKAVASPEKNCSDILYQIKAVRSALKKVGDVYVEDYMETCMDDPSPLATKKTRITDTLKAILKQ